jgi:hypothetical protein
MFRVLSSRMAMLAIASLCALGPSARARAFSDATFYFKTIAEGGSQGRWFTGSPADGYSCNVCHTGGKSWPVYVTGLPTQGYVPGTDYQLRILWPEWSAQELALLAASPMNDPNMELVTELVSESGNGSGTLTLQDAQFETAAEKCTRPPNEHAADIYTVRQDGATPSPYRLDCTTGDVNARCLVIVKGCGAREVHMKWTAPAEWQGNIWFNAGFVSTNQTSGFPNDSDGTTEVSIPLAPAASTSASYTSKLASGCSVRSVGTAGAAGWLGLTIWLVVLRRLPRRRQREARS